MNNVNSQYCALHKKTCVCLSLPSPPHVFLDSNPLIKLNIEPETKQFSEILFIRAQRMYNMQLNGTLVSLYSPCCSKLDLECIAPHPTGDFTEIMTGSYLIECSSRLNK